MDNFKLKKNFISKEESIKIIDWINSINHSVDEPNYHLKFLSKSLNGNSYIFDISNTDITNYITKFQSISAASKEELPEFIYSIIDRISKEFNFPKDNIFLQAVDMKKGGEIKPHYDPSISGFINYKVNISILSDNYLMFIGEDSIEIEEGDLYGFEASLYKHWTNKFDSRRVFLSFGFLLPYSLLNRSDNDPRVRMSKRIERYFQKMNI